MHPRFLASRRGCAIAASLMLVAGAVSAQERVVKIGVASPLTGGGAAYGKDIENGVRLAVDEANARHPTIGGKPVKFVLDSQDDQSDPITAILLSYAHCMGGAFVLSPPNCACIVSESSNVSYRKFL